jgi:hypothetical protein
MESAWLWAEQAGPDGKGEGAGASRVGPWLSIGYNDDLGLEFGMIKTKLRCFGQN